MTSHQTVVLGVGRHTSPEAGVCVMELASMLAGERFTDHPRSVCPIIGRFLRTLNDGLDDQRRQQLYGIAAMIVGSAAGRRACRRRRALCRQRNLEVRGATGRVDWLFSRLLRDDAGNACAAAFLEAGRQDEAIAFVGELLAVSRPHERRCRRVFDGASRVLAVTSLTGQSEVRLDQSGIPGL